MDQEEPWLGGGNAMPWWGWIIVGSILFGSELMLVDAAFYLVFIGAAAIVTGLVGMAGVGLELWMQWLLFSVLSVVAMLLFRDRLYKKLRAVKTDYGGGPAGDIIRLEEDLQPGESCRQKYRGTTWTVLNRGHTVVEKGKDVRIETVTGLTLVIGQSQ
jgi:membrane protein implicated in regulation of membrane protease activity